jgi:S1-C subfamily serine protease
MKTKKVLFYLITLALLLTAGSCNNEKKIPSTSEMLEKSLASVVTVKTTSKSIGKTVFGLAGNSTTDVTYARMLKIGDASGTGSGFVVDYKGKKYLITNAHVIESVESADGSIFAFSYSRKEYSLELIGGDSFYDIAVLKFKDSPPDEISVLPFAEDGYELGEEVFAIGNPLGYFPYTVTQGIISALNRPGFTAKAGYLQTTAMLSRGNSGGPLINKKGELVGINTYISQEDRQLNFALESKTIKRVVTDIIDNGRVQRAFFGLEIVQDYQYFRDENGNIDIRLLDNVPRIHSIMPNSPAYDKIALMKDARISKANGFEICSLEDLLNVMESLKPKDTLILTLDKDNFRQEYTIIAGELTAEKLAEIGNYYFISHYEISASSSDKGYVILTYPNKGYKNNTFQAWIPLQKKFMTYTPKGEQAYVVAIGNYSNIEDQDYWRIYNMKDFGSALRLSALNGQVVFMDYNGANACLVRVLLSNKEDIMSKTLLN